MTTISTIQLKRGNKLALEKTLVGDKKPLRGEPVWEIDTNKLKLGDGEHNYVDLTYIKSQTELNVDGKSIDEENGKLSIFNYNNATVGTFPRKTENGIEWEAIVIPDSYTKSEIDEMCIVVEGYYYTFTQNNTNYEAFFKEANHINSILPVSNKLYRDISSKEIYYFDRTTNKYIKLINLATSNLPGLVKLYDNVGNNTDGTMTQRAITAELNKKLEFKSYSENIEQIELGTN